MAAPADTTRLDPGASSGNNRHLDNGHSTKIAFARDPDVSFWEKTVPMPGLEGGDPIETTTMHNSTWRTFASRSLITLTPITITAAYDPAVFEQIRNNLLNQNGAITVTLPDGSTLSFWGYLQTFEPEALEEGTFPMANITIVPTNYDDATDNDEADPVYTDVIGT